MAWSGYGCEYACADAWAGLNQSLIDPRVLVCVCTCLGYNAYVWACRSARLCLVVSMQAAYMRQAQDLLGSSFSLSEMRSTFLLGIDRNCERLPPLVPRARDMHNSLYDEPTR